MDLSYDPALPLAPEVIEALNIGDVELLRAVVMALAHERSDNPKIGNRNAWLLAVNGPLRLAATLAAEIGTDVATLHTILDIVYADAIKQKAQQS